jgi:hypothetical protein
MAYVAGRWDERDDGTYRNEPPALVATCPTCGKGPGEWCDGGGTVHDGRGGYTSAQTDTAMAVQPPG